MSFLASHFISLSSAWEVFRLFIIPIGGGIPGGVVLAQNRGIDWVGMTILYLLSDILLACVIEPVVLLFFGATRKSPFVARLRAVFQMSLSKITVHYGTPLGPLTLILLAFGTDPMTGRAVTASEGHGFIVGWTLAILGDLLYFTLLMVSTIWLHGILGDGTWTTITVLVLMMVVPAIVRRIREGISRVEPPGLKSRPGDEKNPREN